MAANYWSTSANTLTSRTCCLLLFLFSYSLKTLSQHSELSFRNYTLQDGLAGNNIQTIFQDSRRFLWIGTTDGLSRFDGTHFINYYHNSNMKTSLPSNIIKSVIEYRTGHLLISCVSGSRCYDMAADSFYLPHDEWIRTTLFLSIVSDLQEGWWLCNSESIRRVDSNLQIKENINLENKPFDQFEKLHVLPGNRIMLLTNKGLFRMNPKTNECTPLQMEFNEHLPATGVYSTFYNANTNNLIITEWDRGVYFIDLITKRLKFFPARDCDGCFKGQPGCVYVDKTGNSWIGTYANGISVYNKVLDRFQSILHEDQIASSLIHDEINFFYEDDENNIWIGTARGLSKLSRRMRSVEIHRRPWECKGTRQDIYGISKDAKGNLYIAAFQNGVFQYNTVTGRTKHLEGLATAWSANCFDDTVYMTGHAKGFFQKYNINTGQLVTSYELASFFTERSNLIVFAHKDSYGDWWWSINENGGLVRLPNGSNHLLHYPGRQKSPGFPHSYAMQITEDEQGNMWFAYNKRHEIICWIRNENRFTIIEPHIQVRNGLALTTGIQALLADKKGSIWIGTQGGGLFQYDLHKGNATNLNSENGLPSNDIKTLIMDKAGRLWAGTSKGISCFVISENRFVNFSKKDGLPENYINEGPRFYDQEANRIYLAAADFLLSFSPDSLLQSSNHSTPVYLEAVWVNGKKQLPSPDGLRLHHTENNLRFDFSSVDLISPESPVISYQLEGADKGWQVTHAERSAVYHSLRNGNYTFRLRVQKVGTHEWSTIDIPLQIVIQPAWWQAWWFFALVIMFVLLSAYFVIREVIYHKLEKQRLDLGKQAAINSERLRISSELHDDLGGGLSTIRLMSELVQQDNANGESRRHLEKISFNSKELIQKMNEIVWALNIKNDTLRGLLVYIRQYAVRFMDDNMLAFDLVLPDQVPDISITGSRRRDIFLLVKESLNNIIKHARASKVRMRIVINNSMQIIIHDDGVGFDTSDLSVTGNGLRNMGKRVAGLTGTMAIKNHNGTTIIFDIPLKTMSHESVQ